MRKFLNVKLCWDCYTIPEITDHVQKTRKQLMVRDAQNNKWKCALCDLTLFDPMTLQIIHAYERDHTDVFMKSTAVWEPIVSGAPFNQVILENDKCRNLCIRCHSAVTCAVGILRLKKSPLELSLYIKQRALYQVETLTKMLLRG